MCLSLLVTLVLANNEYRLLSTFNEHYPGNEPLVTITTNRVLISNPNYWVYNSVFRNIAEAAIVVGYETNFSLYISYCIFDSNKGNGAIWLEYFADIVLDKVCAYKCNSDISHGNFINAIGEWADNITESNSKLLFCSIYKCDETENIIWGSVCIKSGNQTMKDTNSSQNSAWNSPGAYFSSATSIDVQYCSFTDNICEYGGGSSVFTIETIQSATIQYCNFVSNSGQYLIHCMVGLTDEGDYLPSVAHFSNCFFDSNTISINTFQADDNGGEITLTNCYINSGYSTSGSVTTINIDNYANTIALTHYSTERCGAMLEMTPEPTTMMPTLKETPVNTPETTIKPTVQETIGKTPEKSALIPATPKESPLASTLVATRIETPFRTPIFTPKDSPINTPIITPKESFIPTISFTIGATNMESPNETPDYSPHISPFETHYPSQSAGDETPVQSSTFEPSPTLDSTPLLTPTFDQTSLETPKSTLDPTSFGTPEYTPHQTAQESMKPSNDQTLDVTAQESLIQTFYQTPDETEVIPDQSPIITPFDTMKNTLLNTLSFTHQPSNSFEPTPETPIQTLKSTNEKSPEITPVQTLSVSPTSYVPSPTRSLAFTVIDTSYSFEANTEIIMSTNFFSESVIYTIFSMVNSSYITHYPSLITYATISKYIVYTYGVTSYFYQIEETLSSSTDNTIPLEYLIAAAVGGLLLISLLICCCCSLIGSKDDSSSSTIMEIETIKSTTMTNDPTTTNNVLWSTQATVEDNELFQHDFSDSGDEDKPSLYLSQRKKEKKNK